MSSGDLMRVATEGDVDQIKHILDDPVNRILDFSGQTALHKAAGAVKTEIVKELLHRGAKPNIQDKDGQTALHKVVGREGNEVIVKELLSRGADVNIQDKFGEAALHNAVRLGEGRNTVKELLTRGAKLNMQNKCGQTALHMAGYEGNAGLAEELLSQGADPNVQDEDNNTALHLVCQFEDNHSGICDVGEFYRLLDLLLLHPKVEVNLRNKDGETPLAVALDKGQPRLAIQKLIHHGSSVTDVKNDESTALHLVTQHSHADVLVLDDILSNKNIGIDQRDRAGNTALMYACERRWGHDTICLLVERLLTNGAKADICKKSGETPLHAFCNKKDSEAKPEIVSKLIDLLVRSSHGIINAKDEKGWTPLHTAIWNGSKECAIDLVGRKGIAVNEKTADQDEWTPLHMACNKRHFYPPAKMFDIVKKLIETGADVNLQDSGGNTALHLACSTQDEGFGGEWEIVQQLLDQEAIQLHTLNHRGFTPFMAAAKADASVDFLFGLLSHTGGTLLGWNRITGLKRSHSMAFEEYDTEEEAQEEGEGESRPLYGSDENFWPGPPHYSESEDFYV